MAIDKGSLAAYMASRWDLREIDTPSYFVTVGGVNEAVGFVRS